MQSPYFIGHVWHLSRFYNNTVSNKNQTADMKIPFKIFLNGFLMEKLKGNIASYKIKIYYLLRYILWWLVELLQEEYCDLYFTQN